MTKNVISDFNGTIAILDITHFPVLFIHELLKKKLLWVGLYLQRKIYMVQYLSNSTFSLDLHCWVCRVNHNNTAWISVPRYRLKHVCAVKCLECHRVWMCHKVACQAPVQRLRECKASNNGRRKMWRGTIKLRLAWSLLFILWGKFSAMLNHYAVEHDLQKYSRALRASLPFLYWKIMGLYPIKNCI